MMDSNDDYIVDGEFQSRRRLEFEGRDNNIFPESNTIDENEVRDYDATVDITKKIEVIHGEIDDKLIPKGGFSIRKSKGYKGKDGTMINRIFCCSCEGYREKNKKDINVKIHRAETRFGCLAKMKIDCRQIGNYQVVKFIAHHTHVTSSPNKSHLHRSHRKLTPTQSAEIDLADSCGIAPKASCDMMARGVGGRENLGFIPRDCRNYLRTRGTTQMRQGDAGGVFEYLQPKNLSGVFERFREFAKDLSECIYEYEEEDEFLDAWEMMLEKYNLKSNEWLEKMFRLKKNWAMVYGRETFCADMMTTQRSESMNNVLKKYVSYKHDLMRFFHHFDRLIEDRRYEELTYDFKATQSSLKLSVNIEILKHASSIYTPAVFKMFQVELGKAYDCVLSICGDDGMLTKYKVTHHKRRFHLSVEFNSSNDTVICSCKKFEFSGILCSHALKVLSSKNVLKIPTQYILKRWTKYAKHGEREVVSKSSLNEDAKASMAKRYRDLCRLQTQVATKAAMTEQTYEIAMNSLYKVIEDVEAHMRGMEVQDLDSSNN
ncbi:hypothetical protein EZV62_001762 [Acer yangbiense]|uniref:Protein FAR1-RELATED SEQUENCE n=1 Tax=Acer yangbiense TaxID=1000413 RepID=A0A5C7IVC1_9ROSI|nr:hypothetical protein EZV62_001762 [Acer yangbiense]